ncbi:FMN-binding negative transcriptional regulator [Rhodobacter ferrooxidans]|uniref:FMN-binding negative transcriptional regulator n=1 Tax=Rhodobacter ferrooxidans TaxID=371731 RepID=C8RWY5_9RHOB|nr:FMN-binding negative transcriptional regulator [Rhodobacter sp. SW2]EEW26510.1 FMN-binding negative transcriptional regulator [Rhodobacter sp. SW2]
MHSNPAFRQTPAAEAIAIVRSRSFGTLCLNGAEGPLLSHVPFELAADGSHALLHLARGNPIARAALPMAAVLAVSGPDAYVSPDWYGATDQVPTLNYVAVHLRGVLQPMPEADLAPMLDRLSALFEARLAPKQPWTGAKMTPGVMERMMRMILPFRLQISRIDSTVKLNQNKTAGQRAGAAAGIIGCPVGIEAARLAEMMCGVDVYSLPSQP